MNNLKQSDWNTIRNILLDVWITAGAYGKDNLQRDITINAKAIELAELMEWRGLLLEDGMLKNVMDKEK